MKSSCQMTSVPLWIKSSLSRGMLDSNHQRQRTIKENTVSFTATEELIIQSDEDYKRMVWKRAKCCSFSNKRLSSEEKHPHETNYDFCLSSTKVLWRCYRASKSEGGKRLGLDGSTKFQNLRWETVDHFPFPTDSRLWFLLTTTMIAP